MSLIQKIFNTPAPEKKSKDAIYYMMNGSLYLTDYSNVKLAVEGYKQNLIIFRCITLIVEKASIVEYDLFFKDKLVEDRNDPLLKILHRPFFKTTKTEFLNDVLSSFLIYGQAYIWTRYVDDNKTPIVNKPPVFLQNLFPDRMEIVEGNNFMPSAYHYNDKNLSQKFDVSITGESNIIHMKTFNPTSYFQGFSPMIPAGFAIDQNNELSKWNLKLLQNGARPSGILTAPKEAIMTDDTINRLKVELQESYSGSGNSGKPMLLTDGMTWTQLGLNPAEMDYTETEKNTIHKIALAYRVPMQLLNTTESKFENLQTANEQLMDEAVIPLVNRYFDELNMDLVPRYGKDQILKPNFDKSIVLINKKVKERDSLEKISYFTVNEKRKKTGEQPIAGGDTLFIQMNQIPIDQAGMQLDDSSSDSNSDSSDKFNQYLLSNELTKDNTAELSDITIGKY